MLYPSIFLTYFFKDVEMFLFYIYGSTRLDQVRPNKLHGRSCLSIVLTQRLPAECESRVLFQPYTWALHDFVMTYSFNILLSFLFIYHQLVYLSPITSKKKQR
jgi:hypothetical protein